MHSYTFPYKEGRALRDLEGVFGGGGNGGVAIYETRGFQFLNLDFSQSRDFLNKHVSTHAKVCVCVCVTVCVCVCVRVCVCVCVRV